MDGSEGICGTVDFAAPAALEASGARPRALAAAGVATDCGSLAAALSPTELPDDASGAWELGGAEGCA